MRQSRNMAEVISGSRLLLRQIFPVSVYDPGLAEGRLIGGRRAYWFPLLLPAVGQRKLPVFERELELFIMGDPVFLNEIRKLQRAADPDMLPL